MNFHCVDPEFVTSRCLIIHPSPIATKHLCIHASSSWTKPEKRSSQWIWWDVPGAQSSLCCHVSMCIRCTAPNEQHWFYCASGCQLPTWTAKRRMDFCPPTGRSSKSSCETTLQCPHGYPQLMGYRLYGFATTAWRIDQATFPPADLAPVHFCPWVQRQKKSCFPCMFSRRISALPAPISLKLQA